ncbi:MAG: hypothetical protein Q4E34_02840 [Synergistaceae bacterium]|nr:hypothetical protein [Synergistaceae bacterium]
MSWSTRQKVSFFLIVVILILLVSVLWSLNKVGGYVGSLNVSKVFVCSEIEPSSIPAPVSGKLNYGQNQLCIWFEYEHAGKDDKVKITCYRDKEEIIRQQIALAPKQGVRAFYLVKGDGSSLPAGKYSVVISNAVKVWKTVPESFEIIDADEAETNTKNTAAMKRKIDAQNKNKTDARDKSGAGNKTKLVKKRHKSGGVHVAKNKNNSRKHRRGRRR